MILARFSYPLCDESGKTVAIRTETLAKCAAPPAAFFAGDPQDVSDRLNETPAMAEAYDGVPALVTNCAEESWVVGAELFVRARWDTPDSR